VGLRRRCVSLPVSSLARGIRHRRRRVVSSHVGPFNSIADLVLLLNQRAATAAIDLHAVLKPVSLEVVLSSDLGALRALQDEIGRRNNGDEKAIADARSVAGGVILQIAVTESVLGLCVKNAG